MAQTLIGIAIVAALGLLYLWTRRIHKKSTPLTEEQVARYREWS